MRFVGFIGPSYTSSSVNVDCQRCMNLFPETDPLGTGKDGEVAALVSSPGLTKLLTLPASPLRGAWTSSSGQLYVVGGSKLYSISSSWVATELGTLNTSTGPVSMADNGTQLVVVDGPNGYYLSTATLTTATTVTSGATTTLTNLSKTYQTFTGTGSQTVVLPAVATLSVGNSFYIENLSTSTITVQSSDTTSLQVMAPNSLLIMTCKALTGSGPTPWILNYAPNNHVTGGTFAPIADPNFLGSSQVSYLDGYFVFIKPNSQQFYLSDLNAVTFNALNTGSAEGSPDYLVGQIANQQNIYFFGTQSTEVFYDAGTTPCPLSRIQGAMIQVGCAAPFSIAKLQSTIYWLGGDDSGFGIVYQMQGYQPQRISTPSIEAAIRSVGSSNVANARAWTYQQGGHTFYCLNVPGLNSTWVYDSSTSLWHERTFLGSFGFERHRADCSTVAFGKNVVGDYASGNIYSLDSGNSTDNGTAIVRLRAAPHISKDMVRLFHSRFQLDMETGVGLSGTGQGTNPQAVLQWSDDGGHTWSNEKWASVGAIGATKTRVIWRRLGKSRDRVYRIMIADPVRVTLIGAEVDVEPGVA